MCMCLCVCVYMYIYVCVFCACLCVCVCLCLYVLGHVCYVAEMAKVHTSFTQVEVQILMFKKTLIKVEVLTTLFHSSYSKEVWALTYKK